MLGEVGGRVACDSVVTPGSGGDRQGAVKRDNSTTKRFLAEAGICAGMHVLEIGCGGGEVTRLLAELVGPSGRVVALDRNEAALPTPPAPNVEFLAVDITGDLKSLEQFPRGSFQALAGRRVLMYLAEPAEVLGRLSEWLEGGALVVFEEADSTLVPGRLAPLPAHDQATEWFKRMLLAEGANPSMGFHLPATLARAGFHFAKVRGEAVIQGQGSQFPMADLLTMMMSRIVSAAIATAAEVDSLVERLREEASDPTRVFVSDISFCAWAHTSGGTAASTGEPDPRKRR